MLRACVRLPQQPLDNFGHADGRRLRDALAHILWHEFRNLGIYENPPRVPPRGEDQGVGRVDLERRADTEEYVGL